MTVSLPLYLLSGILTLSYVVLAVNQNFGSESLPSGHFRLTHGYAHLPGSSHSGVGGIMTWDHFSMLRKHDKARFRQLERGRRLVQTVHGADLPLSGDTDPLVAGLYWTKVGLGTPSVQYSVQIDTGSDVLWVQCEPCDSCPTSSDLVTLARPFDPTLSSTYTATTCTSSTCATLQSTYSHLADGCNVDQPSDDSCYYLLRYGDGSSTLGSLGRDVMSYTALNGAPSLGNVTFGCGFNQSGNLVSSGSLVDGLLGLGQGPLSVTTQLTASGALTDSFAHCLGGEDEGAGALVLGAVEADGAVYTPLDSSSGRSNYFVTALGITVGSTSLSGITESTFGTAAGNGGTIFDSGTTLALVPQAVYTGVTEELARQVSLELLPFSATENQYCWLYTGNSVSDYGNFFPNITYIFLNASMELEPQNYLLLLPSTTGQETAACFGWQSTADAGISVSVLGDIFLRDKLVIYDKGNQRLGWLNTNCISTIIEAQNVSIIYASSSSARLLTNSLGWLCLFTITTFHIFLYYLLTN